MFNFFINTAHAAISLPNFTNVTDLGQFIGEIYFFSLTIVGAIFFVRFIYAGFLYLTAAGNASNTTKAKKIMRDALFGLVLLFSAYLILYVINPDLVNRQVNFGSYMGTSPYSCNGFLGLCNPPTL